MPEQAVISRLRQSGNWLIKMTGGLLMTFDHIIDFVTCVAFVVDTVITVLTYLKKISSE